MRYVGLRVAALRASFSLKHSLVFRFRLAAPLLGRLPHIKFRPLRGYNYLVMTRKSPSKTADITRTRRAEQMTEIDQVLADLRRQRTNLRAKQKKQLELLTSAVKGHYEEMDKLSKKAPAEKVTDLALGEVNYTIEETKKLLEEDVFIQRLNVFVAAGDNPELRDVVLVLRQLLQGLARYDANLKPRQDKLKAAIDEALGIKEVLKLYIEDGHTAKARDENLSYSTKENLPKDWWHGGISNTFLFERLDEMIIEEYFKERVES